ncbi:hypothetical protein SAMN04489835_0488 [Mycolicibacterium rutilum]|uniref:Uncharacterized protein n=1 Tax=Mycolicibacterium rutilum TaxID=370526 RepID=A0A1H6IL59_MYCRU|nr:hypothetical protein [Mycolicibacterium rutilum]SEH49377.1 hypothetical protein SAMN04489835_0488 [Mycolicibacterium rutilum]
MSSEAEGAEPRTDEHHNVLDEPEERPGTEKPEVTDEHREKAKEMHKAYEEERPTTKMPGTGGAVAGTAVNDWLDDDGNPKYSEGASENSENTTGSGQAEQS